VAKVWPMSEMGRSATPSDLDRRGILGMKAPKSRPAAPVVQQMTGPAGLPLFLTLD
jgi:hypothetical protein